MNVIIRDHERISQCNDSLREYGVNPETATSFQKDMADCIAQKTNEAYAEARKMRRR